MIMVQLPVGTRKARRYGSRQIARHISPYHKVFVSSIMNSFVPFDHDAPSPLVRLGAFAIVAEERGFLKLLWRSFCGGSLLLSGRVNSTAVV